MKHPRLRELVLLAAIAGIFGMGYLQIGETATVGFAAFVIVFAALHLVMRVLAPRADPLILPAGAFLVSMGLMQLASIDRACTGGFGERSCPPNALTPLQAGWLAAAAGAFAVVLFIFRRGLGPAWRIRYTLALLGIGALLAPMIPGLGHTVNGARLWLRLGPLSFQPGEAAKVLLVLFLAAYLAERRELLTLPTRRLGPVNVPDPRYLAPLLGLVALALFIFVQQNDLGSSLLFFITFMAILWVATGKLVYPVTGIALFAAGVVAALRLFGHVRGRFTAWLDPGTDPLGTGYQILVGQYAMAEGGIRRLTGIGLGNPEAQPDLIPVGYADLALATIGYLFGLAGVLAIVAAFLLLLTRTFYTALRSRSDLHALAATGFGVVLGFQAGMIAGGVTRVLPLTGVTLPFVSYGGSSLLANFVILACLVAISNSENTTETIHPARATAEVAA